MFGALCLMVNGHMAVGVVDDRIFVRLEAEDARKALTEPGVEVVDFTGRPSRNMVYITELDRLHAAPLGSLRCRAEGEFEWRDG
jgi:TfoX/Sxy family transcriptional regulator of competence genes